MTHEEDKEGTGGIMEYMRNNPPSKLIGEDSDGGTYNIICSEKFNEEFYKSTRYIIGCDPYKEEEL
jgi:hypothetical protein